MGPPEVGEAVQVKWPDGLFYGAKYLGSNVSYMYQVKVHSGHVSKMTDGPVFADAALVKCHFNSVSGHRRTTSNFLYSADILVVVTSLTLPGSPGLGLGRWRARKSKRTLETEG